MTHKSSLRILAVLPALLVMLPAVARAGIEAGTAQVDITPPVGGNTVGYSSSKPTDGIHDPVSAQVLVLKSPDAHIAMVSMDLCIFNSPRLHDQVAEMGIDRLLLMNTHTHSGPSMRQLDFPSEDEPWRSVVETRILAAIREAESNLSPAYFSVADGDIQLGYNRLVQNGAFAVTHFDNPHHIPYGEVDPTVGVIRIMDDRSNVRAVLVHYACHPVVLGPRNRKISADYPGVMRRIVAEKLGPSAVCIFVQGGAGDINPLFMARGDDREGDFEVVERMGRLLAEEVIKVLDAMPAERGDSRDIISESSLMTFRHRFEPEKEVQLGVTTLLINGKVGIFTMPGEPFHLFQNHFREKASLPHTYLFGYCCNAPYDWPAYLPDLASAARGGYGASFRTQAEVGAGEALVNRALVQLYSLQGRLKGEPVMHTFD